MSQESYQLLVDENRSYRLIVDENKKQKDEIMELKKKNEESNVVIDSLHKELANQHIKVCNYIFIFYRTQI